MFEVIQLHIVNIIVQMGHIINIIQICHHDLKHDFKILFHIKKILINFQVYFHAHIIIIKFIARILQEFFNNNIIHLLVEI